MVHMRRTWILGVGATTALLFGACSSGVPAEEVAAKDQQISSLQAQLSTAQRDANFWTELVGLFPPVEMPSMRDHRAYMLPSGAVLALHFDNMQLAQAQHLNWVALGVPGKFCQDDQQRVEKQFGKGFTHFHDLMADTHGGKPGAEGVWFVHVGVREFNAPWGTVTPGVDQKFMPTPAPVCDGM
ncbi:MAG: hypothetical protein HYY01_09380 [Chloroflexi bacterium]|nr:hypothetical protein [Chloroflexota bacterium]